MGHIQLSCCVQHLYRYLSIVLVCIVVGSSLRSDVSNSSVKGSGTTGGDQAAWFGDPNGVTDGPTITWTILPQQGLNINNPVDYTWGDGSTERTTMSAQVNWDPKQSMTFQNSSTLLLWVALMWADLDQDYRYPDWPHQNVNARECGLYLCVKEFSSSVTNGTLTETSKEVASTRETTSFQREGQPPQPSLEFGPLYNPVKPVANDTRSDLRINATSSNLPASVSISQAGIQGLIYYLWHAFDDGSMWYKIPNPETREIDWGQWMPNVTGLVRLIPGTHEFQYLPDTMQVFWNGRDDIAGSGIDDIFSNLAQSVTNNLRMTADNATTVSGQEGIVKTFLEVRWPWISLPCVSVIAGGLFLLLAMWDTRKSQAPLWKDSMFATLFHGLSDGVKKAIPKSTSQSAMERDSRSINVRLIEGKKGYELGESSNLANKNKN